MLDLRHNTIPKEVAERGIVPAEANTGSPLKGDFERMARRRYQDPKPFRRGEWWCLLYWQDNFVGGKCQRKRKWAKLAPATAPEREVRKMAAELLRPTNQGLITVGSAINFGDYVQSTYIPTVLPLLARSTQNCYQGVMRKYLVPSFGASFLRDLSPLTLQRYFSDMAKSGLGHQSLIKLRDTLSSILRSTVGYGFLVRNPIEGVRLPSDKKGKRRHKPYITPEQFEHLVELIPEPYASMVYVAVYTGLRISELIGLRWEDVHQDSITIDERYCRGDWGAPKSDSSNATIGVDLRVIQRIQRLKLLTIEVKAGRAIRRYRLVKSDGPQDLVFQSVKAGRPMRDNNILTRFIKPAGRELGIGFVNWRCLRTSHATWLVQAGADPKSVQGQMRHSRISTTMDI
jgi:integrase